MAFVFTAATAAGIYLFPVRGEQRLLEFDHGCWLFLFATWVVYGILIYRWRSPHFKDEWRFLGSIAVSFVAAVVSAAAFLMISIALSGGGT
jgi:hypothetical protein